ncbi:MAG: hypothetical protein UR34_C0010G0019 [candidate division WS6 bacterium GW2011_GWC1_33_20]|uniref:Uncharacterized protein n=2 Tax=Candidatus Dojkabacteria TaxID=74243 RepID=A0A0G0ADT2_9BACT|nr:MAG: hypothetical protein UR34_C0010G0019 [candidate division WS6 bacterium GW2011_GWC1_33_20]KKP44355.1 MAG: hypothetical protein UR36_C0018G0020 [candidate division WS6 bacterium GW2011_GWF1_33_233]KKP54840.1 MAG: hypothetical protein UR45_C0008G0018 [candidate division WS6 bacterium GW2011_WS6_33_547]KKP54974.1 MAG: hypothetical protein UR47_C0007G0032 [candidate division WS6 bacterium GW2011_GWB1_33_6]HBB64517.1 hypothetical protein [Patescibacteria group bacterium]
MKSFLVSVVLIAFAGFFLYYFLFARQTGQYVPDTWGDLPCMYLVNITSNSMEPELKQGTILSMNKCITKIRTFPVDQIVLFQEGGSRKVGRIISGEDDSYVIGQDNRKGEEFTILKEDIIAVAELQSL